MSSEQGDLSFWARVADFLDRALDLEGDERETWLENLTTTEPSIAKAVRQLLGDYDSVVARGFLERSPLTPELEQPAPLEGRRIGVYTIERLLGRGGMGEVWLALRSDGRFEGQCAIKFLTESTAQVAVRSRREGG